MDAVPESHPAQNGQQVAARDPPEQQRQSSGNPPGPGEAWAAGPAPASPALISPAPSAGNNADNDDADDDDDKQSQSSQSGGLNSPSLPQASAHSPRAPNPYERLQQHFLSAASDERRASLQSPYELGVVVVIPPQQASGDKTARAAKWIAILLVVLGIFAAIAASVGLAHREYLDVGVNLVPAAVFLPTGIYGRFAVKSHDPRRCHRYGRLMHVVVVVAIIASSVLIVKAIVEFAAYDENRDLEAQANDELSYVSKTERITGVIFSGITLVIYITFCPIFAAKVQRHAAAVDADLCREIIQSTLRPAAGDAPADEDTTPVTGPQEIC